MPDQSRNGPVSAGDGNAAALLSAIVDSSHDAILSKNLDGVITSWNRSAERVFGYTAQEAVGQTVAALLIPHDRQDEEPRILLRLRTGERVDHFETVRRRKDGSLLDISLTISPVRDSSGKIIGISKIARDITGQVRARAQIADLAERLRITLTSIGDAVITTDAAGKITFLNKVAQALTGWTNGEAAGKPLPEVFRIFNELTRQQAESPVEKALREGRVVGLANHTVLIAKDGQEYAIDDSAAPIRDAEGKIAGVVMVFRDITAQRQAELASRLLASIVESSDDAIIGKDLNGVITAWNWGAEKIFGYSAAEAIGRPISMLATSQNQDEMPKILDRIRSGERVHHFETIRKRKDGTLLNISLTVSPVHDAAGRIVGASKIARDVTEQVRARAQFAELAERLRITLGSIGDAVIATSPNGAVTYLNPVAEDLTGWPLSEAVGKPLSEIFPIVNEETRHPVENPVSKVLREGRVVALANHTLLIARSGQEYAINDSAAPIRDAEGKVVGVVMVFRDNTANREIEKRAAQQAAELRRITHLMEPVACFVRDLQDRIIYWNPGAADLYGYSSDEVIGQVCHSLLKTEFSVPLDAILAQVMASGAWEGELLHRRRDGRQIVVASRWTQHKDDAGSPTAILEVNSDITAKKQTELSLARTQEQLSDELSGTRSLHELASRLLTIEDQPALLHEILATALKITGADKGNIQLVHADGTLQIEAQRGFSNAFLDFFRSVEKGGGTACGVAFERGERVVIKDIERSPIFAGRPALRILLADGIRAVQSTPLTSRRGNLIGILSTHYASTRKPSERDLRLIDILARQAADLIERIRVEDALRTTNLDLARANEDLNQFAFAASHDLQEPLRMITSYSQLLMKGYRGQLGGEAGTCIEFITEGTRRMRELLADLLAYAQVANERQEPAGPVDLNRLFEIVVENCKPAIDETKATVTSDPLPTVQGHEPHFIQLLQNLISNSLKYRSSQPPRIHVSAQSENGIWRIAVQDNGIGIPPQYRKQIFGVFKRLHGKSIPGTGIGLAICQRVVDRYSGTIWVDSQVGQGSTFFFTLPAAEKELLPMKAEPFRILLLEDNSAGVCLFRKALQVGQQDRRADIVICNRP